MYAVTSMPLDSRMRATLRRAEFGFFGVMVLTTVHTPRFCGQPCMAGCFGFDRCGFRGLRMSWLIVGIPTSSGHAGLLLPPAPMRGPAPVQGVRLFKQNHPRGARGAFAD